MTPVHFRLKRLLEHPWNLLIGALAYIPFLGLMNIPVTGDQKVYLNIALEMRERGSWLIPYLEGEPSYFKPPLQYWATLMGWKIFGWNLWGAFIPSVLAALVTAWFIGEIAGLIHQRRDFSQAGVWFLASLGTATYGVTAQMEIWLCLFFSGAWWAALRFLADDFEARNPKWLYVALTFAGLLCLVKSPLYGVLWGIGFVVYLLISGEWEVFRHRSFYVASILGTLIGSSWYFYVLIVDGARFWDDYFVRENLQKQGGNSTSWYGIWFALLYMAFPMTFLLIPATRSLIKKFRSDQMLRFLACWCLPAGLFFTFFPYRVNTYLYLLVPACAVLMDWGFFRERRSAVFHWMLLFTGFALFFFCEIISLVLNQEHLVSFWIVIGFGLSGVWAMICVVRDWYPGLVMTSLSTVFLFHAVIASLGAQDLKGLKSTLAEVGVTREVVYLDEAKSIWHESGLLSIAIKQRVHQVFDTDQALEALRRGAVVIVNDGKISIDRREFEARLLGQGERRELIDMPWMRWKRRLNLPLRELVTKPKALPGRDTLLREFRIYYLKT